MGARISRGAGDRHGGVGEFGGRPAHIGRSRAEEDSDDGASNVAGGVGPLLGGLVGNEFFESKSGLGG